MGVGGKFWDLLKPYARREGFDYLRDKRVAVDLSFWIVQHETAVKASVRKPHLRLTFFRTINLFSKFGAYPVFVVDGTPSPLKYRARIVRFFRSSGIDISSLAISEDGVSVERNRAFSECVRECVELLELLGIPVMKANGEAEVLCAQLNKEGQVDACITSDSDAFLFGAKCVVKSIRPNSREPFECFHLSDIEAGLGLKRKHLIAISLLVGNDYDLGGVQGIGMDTAVSFVQTFGEHEILDRLHDIGKGVTPAPQSKIRSADDDESVSDVGPQTKRPSHCSFCGHPGSKRTHFKLSCEFCGTGSGCIKMPSGVRCECFFCCKEREEKEQKKIENWWTKVCNRISQEPNFPSDDIIKLYLCDNYRDLIVDGCTISWKTPDTEILVDFLVFQLLWEPSYIRKMMLPMLSTVYMRETAKSPVKTLLYGQYEFHSIQRIKKRYGHEYFVVKWWKSVPTFGSVCNNAPVEESSIAQEKLIEDEEPVDMLDGSNEPQIHVDDEGCFLLTDESISLVQSAFPDQVQRFLHAKELRESKRKKIMCQRSESESPKSTGVQWSMTDFYRSIKAKGDGNSKISEERTSSKKRKQSSSNLSKSVRRRLLFG